mmetsp:Transcript_23805/g.26764  ORF Transcript_23805/g.26764 Transcript_23805/m.26764 type:complete len:147 (+) Transcript_23805:138-578(+)
MVTMARGRMFNASSTMSASLHHNPQLQPSSKTKPQVLRSQYWKYINQREQGDRGGDETARQHLQFHEYFNMETLVDFALEPNLNMYPTHLSKNGTTIQIDHLRINGRRGSTHFSGKIQKLTRGHKRSWTNWSIHTLSNDFSLIKPF